MREVRDDEGLGHVALRVVLANGKVTPLRRALAKNRAGYDLVHLFVGSEGTLGVITEACLKIVPLPTVKTRRFLVTFGDWESTGEVIRRLRSSKILPYLFEFLDRDNIQALNEKLEMSLEEAEATLLVDVEEGEVDLATADLQGLRGEQDNPGQGRRGGGGVLPGQVDGVSGGEDPGLGRPGGGRRGADRQAGRVSEVRQGGRRQARDQDPRQRARGRRQRAPDDTLRQGGRRGAGPRRSSPTRNSAGRR